MPEVRRGGAGLLGGGQGSPANALLLAGILGQRPGQGGTDQFFQTLLRDLLAQRGDRRIAIRQEEASKRDADEQLSQFLVANGLPPGLTRAEAAEAIAGQRQAASQRQSQQDISGLDTPDIMARINAGGADPFLQTTVDARAAAVPQQTFSDLLAELNTARIGARTSEVANELDRQIANTLSRTAQGGPPGLIDRNNAQVQAAQGFAQRNILGLGNELLSGEPQFDPSTAAQAKLGNELSVERRIGQVQESFKPRVLSLRAMFGELRDPERDVGVKAIAITNFFQRNIDEGVVRPGDVDLIFSTQSFGQKARLIVRNLMAGFKGDPKQLFANTTSEDMAEVAEVLRQANEKTYLEQTQNLQKLIDDNEFALSIPNPFSREGILIGTGEGGGGGGEFVMGSDGVWRRSGGGQ